MNTASSTSSAVAAATATTTATATSMAHATATTSEPVATATASDDWFALDAADTTASTPLYDVATLRAIEQAGLDSLPPFTLMARAGAAAADWIARHAPAGKVLCLAGAGNNGGDALVAATRLHQAGRRVEAWLTGVPDRLPADAARAWAEARAAGVPVLAMAQDESAALPPWPADCVAIADGLLGIGLNRPAQGQAARWIEHVNASGLPVFALDIPSGLFADTGLGQPAIRAQRTLTFLTAKPGLLTLDGRDCAGALDIAPLGLAYPPMQVPTAIVNQPAGFAATLPARAHAANKGHFGQLAVIGGSVGMTGAPLLGARAALYLGAGRVHIGFLADNAPSADFVHPELMLHAVARVATGAMSALVIGPGMGTGAESATALAALLDACVKAEHRPALVLDADALNLLAADAALAARLIASGLPCVLTPHPLEAARLLGVSVPEVQRDRLAAARALAQQWRAVVVLKGSGTIVAAPDGGTPPPVINPTGNAALATAGTGDVLAGMTGALLAQGMATHAAACAAVWIHGRAADAFVAAGLGPAGMTASELYGPARQILNALLRGAPA
ncbi:Bifunctional NAD(P)H-hydrate repair enzyme Nnr [Cupriavidus pampae]|uniref:Bifunctional NAD(P)H-hydrate repair enzyme n=2 Tax=Cupriavidus pampae TaxID=659251 RepID=A0ABN7XTH1_9BURK|nr:Bifunctional NAD(P)H-hydrate repair enzyme Nnr [Cupriavidus pampae]